jgi:cytochrome c oxidase cbb3-type subunit 3
MYQEVLDKITGIGLYGIVSILIFFVFFSGMLIWSLALKKNYLSKMGSLPLDGGEQPDASHDNINS